MIGYGYWGPNLLRNLVAHGGVEVVGVVESKVEIQIVRRASSQGAGQVVDSLGPYMLRC